MSGHVLSSDGFIRVVESKGGWGYSGTLSVQGRELAEIDGRLKEADYLKRAERVRATTVTFGDQTRWTILTEAPDEPKYRKKFLGISYRARAEVNDRVGRVSAESTGKVLAEARWPDPKVQKEKVRESLDLSRTRERIHFLNSDLLDGIFGFLPKHEVPQITVDDESKWLVPVETPTESRLHFRLGETLTIFVTKRGGDTRTKLIPDAPCPLEAALLSWHIAIGDTWVKPKEPWVGG